MHVQFIGYLHLRVTPRYKHGNLPLLRAESALWVPHPAHECPLAAARNMASKVDQLVVVRNVIVNGKPELRHIWCSGLAGYARGEIEPRSLVLLEVEPCLCA